MIQGGFDREARKRSAAELIELGFDGYGFGGYIVENGRINLELSAFVADLVPRDKIGFALGFGRPWDIAALWDMGWECSIAPFPPGTPGTNGSMRSGRIRKACPSN